jgi:hypothetical protein
MDGVDGVGVEGVPGIASGRSSSGCSPPVPGGLPGVEGLVGVLAGALFGGVAPGGGAVLAGPGNMPPSSVRPVSSEPDDDEQAMRFIANPTIPRRAIDAFTIGPMREAGLDDRRNDADRDGLAARHFCSFIWTWRRPRSLEAAGS